ncbi:hypothetical protein L390_00270 [Klebsiella quasipneumoniae subsp. similipneumoniae]|jgi:hypothetical protein|nr:hypothetical protein L390_00270 [Klebsiella quasipneumoniae subsp. similipneumoniae]
MDDNEAAEGGLQSSEYVIAIPSFPVMKFAVFVI